MQTQARHRIRDLPLVGSRMPIELREWLVDQARRNHRSMSGQLVALVEAERERQGTQASKKPTA